MIYDNSDIWEIPLVRRFSAKVELYKGSTLANTFTNTDALKSFTVNRVGDNSKFFGFGVCQKLTLKLVDSKREIDITSFDSVKVYIRENERELITPFPTFYINESNRDEITNEITLVGYDLIYSTTALKVSDLGLSGGYTIENFVAAVGTQIGTTSTRIIQVPEEDTSFSLFFSNGANFDGSEDLRSALNAAAEATQTIYYIDNTDGLTFKRLKSDSASFTIGREDYFTLTQKDSRKLTNIIHATELGDNVSASIGEDGITQYVRDNPFWSLREDIGTILENAVAAIGGLTIYQFDCKWRGSYFLEVGDRIQLITKDDGVIEAYILNDIVDYNGGFSQTTEWKYEENKSESSSNPSTLGEALKKTYARVDKAKQEIEMVISKTGANEDAITALQLDTASINASVSDIQTNLDNQMEEVKGDVETITKKVDATMTAEDVVIEIQKEVAKGANKVNTTTGFTFDDNGLNVSKSDSEMSTTITEDGMKVYKNNEEVLTANNAGVYAKNLHATTYLIIGKNSRFEDFGNRTGCFWIGG